MAYRPDVDALEGRQLLTSYKFLTLASISSAEDAKGSLVMDARGDLFGTTINGGTAGEGTLFELPKGGHRIITLSSFTSATGQSVSSLTSDSRGDVFGTTEAGGANNGGTIFELARGSRRITALASFGLGPGGETVFPTNLTRDSHGNLYGTALIGPGSAGFLYELRAGSHTILTLYSFQALFSSGQAPFGSDPGNGLAVDAHGDLFGTYFANAVALQPGNAGSAQTFLFELPKGADTINRLATIDESSGGPPFGLVLAKNGTLYGVVTGGGDPNGSVFSYVPGSGASTVTTLATFNGPDGEDPNGNPVVDAHGNVFGTTAFGGPDFNPSPGLLGSGPLGGGAGTVYEIAAGSHTVTSLVGFNSANGFDPAGLVQDSRGDSFGVVGNPGEATIFELAVVPTPRMRR